MLRTIRYLLLAGLALLVLALSFGFGAYSRGFSANAPAPVASQGLPQEFRVLGEVWRILQEDFVDRETLEPKKLSQEAIKGLLEGLGDPHTSYIDAEHYKLEKNSFQGSFDGIGAQVAMVDGQLTVVAPIKDTPAEKVGIRSGDKILEVDGESTAGMSLAEAVSRIRGRRGTRVSLIILHRDESTPIKLEIVRGEIRTDSVFLKMLPERIAHIQITYFSQRTNDELEAALREAKNAGAIGIILDLRDNPGGLLEVTVEVASQFLKQGIVLQEVNNKGERRTWRVRSGGLAIETPLAILVNKGSASGSEVVAAALQDTGRAPLIGEQTFGKGSVNHVRELSDGSALYVTFARWLTPKGFQIEGKGLTPDFAVPLTEDDRKLDRDPQLDQGVDYILEKVGPGA